MTCASCGAANDDGHAFCQACGKKLAATCAGCGASLAPGARFCTSCGTAVAEAKRSVVADGVWVRDPSEFVRKVSRDELKGVFGDLDGWFAGTLVGRLLDAVGSRSVRVPMGSVGVLVRDGVAVRVLPPGDQVTAGVLRELLRDAGERFSGLERTALYLVDRRPIPIGFEREVAVNGTRQTLQVTATVAPGSTPTALASFLREIVRDREHLSSAELHAKLRPDVEVAVTDALRAHAADPRAAERAARSALEGRALSGTGLVLELAIARKDTLHRRDLTLGGGGAAEVPCATCGEPVGAGMRFCTSCGSPAAVGGPSEALVTSDGISVVVDLAVEIRGDTAPRLPEDALRAAARAHLRAVTLEALTGRAGFEALAEALATGVRDRLTATGHALESLVVVDVRSEQGDWALGARASMSAARQAAAIGREWLAVKGDERALETETLAAVRAQEQILRDHAFAKRAVDIAERGRQEALDTADRELRARQRQAEHGDTLTASSEAHARAVQAQAHEAELARRRMDLGSERRRREAEEADAEERLRREARLAELRGLAELESNVADREHRHEVERMAKLEGKSEAQMLAMQASRLAEATHGGAFAEALGKLADGEAARRERERADERIDAKDARTMALMEKMLGSAQASETAARGAYRDVAETTKDMAKTAVQSHAQVAAATRACLGCGQTLAATAQFCGVCGTRT